MNDQEPRALHPSETTLELQKLLVGRRLVAVSLDPDPHEGLALCFEDAPKTRDLYIYLSTNEDKVMIQVWQASPDESKEDSKDLFEIQLLYPYPIAKADD